MGQVPILGVCLGHQTLAHMHDLRVIRANEPVHGKTAPIHHDGQGLFAGLPNPFTATRYHSLIVDPSSVPTDGSFVVSAWTGDDEDRRIIMGLRYTFPNTPDPNACAPLEGVQFHPESFLTDRGPDLLANFLKMAQLDHSDTPVA